MSLGIRQERPSAKWSLLSANILLSVDEHSVVQAAQLEELLLYVGAELVEVVHVVLAAVSCTVHVRVADVIDEETLHRLKGDVLLIAFKAHGNPIGLTQIRLEQVRVLVPVRLRSLI